MVVATVAVLLLLERIVFRLERFPVTAIAVLETPLIFWMSPASTMPLLFWSMMAKGTYTAVALFGAAIE